jgi:hypothetical protein
MQADKNDKIYRISLAINHLRKLQDMDGIDTTQMIRSLNLEIEALGFQRLPETKELPKIDWSKQDETK